MVIGTSPLCSQMTVFFSFKTWIGNGIRLTIMDYLKDLKGVCGVVKNLEPLPPL